MLTTWSPPPFFIHQMCSASFIFFILPFPISTGSLCFFLISLTLSLCIEICYFETYLFLILSFIFFFLIALIFSITFWLSFMGIFICCRTLNIPGHSIQTFSIESRRYECPVQECRVGLVRVKVLVSSFVT